MATKAAHTAFNREVSKYLGSIGADVLKKSSFAIECHLTTIAGDLLISLHEPERSEVFSIYCRFEDVEKAVLTLDSYASTNLNRYSGKWNFHSYDAGELLVEFKNEIAPLLINEKV